MKERPSFPAKLDTGSKTTKPKTVPTNTATGFGLDSSTVRARMVQKLAQQGIEDAGVLEAMGRIERHRFVDSALANQAYEDTSLPIGLGQTISKPNVVARMIALLREAPGVQGQMMGRVLEIGTGCGYQAAILGQVSKEVYSIERIQGLYEKAKENLRPMRFPNIHLILGDGMLGFAQGAPYTGIISAAGGENIPTAWLDQLAVGGRLVAPVENEQGSQVLVVIDKFENSYQRSFLEPVNFVPLRSGVA